MCAGETIPEELWNKEDRNVQCDKRYSRKFIGRARTLENNHPTWEVLAGRGREEVTCTQREEVLP